MLGVFDEHKFATPQKLKRAPIWQINEHSPSSISELFPCDNGSTSAESADSDSDDEELTKEQVKQLRRSSKVLRADLHGLQTRIHIAAVVQRLLLPVVCAFEKWKNSTKTMRIRIEQDDMHAATMINLGEQLVAYKKESCRRAVLLCNRIARECIFRGFKNWKELWLQPPPPPLSLSLDAHNKTVHPSDALARRIEGHLAHVTDQATTQLASQLERNYEHMLRMSETLAQRTNATLAQHSSPLPNEDSETAVATPTNPACERPDPQKSVRLRAVLLLFFARARRQTVVQAFGSWRGKAAKRTEWVVLQLPQAVNNAEVQAGTQMMDAVTVRQLLEARDVEHKQELALRVAAYEQTIARMVAAHTRALSASHRELQNTRDAFATASEVWGDALDAARGAGEVHAEGRRSNKEEEQQEGKQAGVEYQQQDQSRAWEERHQHHCSQQRRRHQPQVISGRGSPLGGRRPESKGQLRFILAAMREHAAHHRQQKPHRPHTT
jgi:hypothetical protein